MSQRLLSGNDLTKLGVNEFSKTPARVQQTAAVLAQTGKRPVPQNILITIANAHATDDQYALLFLPFGGAPSAYATGANITITYPESPNGATYINNVINRNDVAIAGIQYSTSSSQLQFGKNFVRLVSDINCGSGGAVATPITSCIVKSKDGESYDTLTRWVNIPDVLNGYVGYALQVKAQETVTLLINVADINRSF